MENWNLVLGWYSVSLSLRLMSIHLWWFGIMTHHRHERFTLNPQKNMNILYRNPVSACSSYLTVFVYLYFNSISHFPLFYRKWPPTWTTSNGHGTGFVDKLADTDIFTLFISHFKFKALELTSCYKPHSAVTRKGYPCSTNAKIWNKRHHQLRWDKMYLIHLINQPTRSSVLETRSYTRSLGAYVISLGVHRFYIYSGVLCY